MIEKSRAELRQAYTLIKAGQATEAMPLLNGVLAGDPDNTEAWWLLAHAAPTAADSVLALQQVILLKPDYAPAQTLLLDKQIQHVTDLIDMRQQREAYAAVRPLIEAYPTNPEVWWLVAQSAPNRTESVAACQKVLVLNPDHAGARRKLADHQTALNTSLVQKQANIQPARARSQKRRAGRWLLVVALVIMALGGLLMTITLTGNNFGLPISGQFALHENIGLVGNKPTVKIGALVIGATHDYDFYGSQGNYLFAAVRFLLTNSSPGGAIRLLDANHNVIAYAAPSNQAPNTATLFAQLPATGQYTLRLIGTAKLAQGAYVAQLTTMSGDGMPSLPALPGG
jgi:hypothetical protein